MITTLNKPYADREFVYDSKIDYGTVVPVDQSSIAGTPAIGNGATILAEILRDFPPGQPKSFAGITDFERVAMVHMRHDTPGRVNGKVKRLVQIPLYFQEVKAFQPIDAEHLRQREVFARATGFVLLGPDECLAVLQDSTDGSYTFCDVFENNDLGVVRELAGIYADSVDFHAKSSRIADLNVTETDRAISKALGDDMWWSRQTDIVSPQQIERMRLTSRLLMAHKSDAPPERRASGALVHRSFISNGDTGSTAHMRPRSEGWLRYPTSQDAWYYGVWANPVKLQTLSYCEQDVTHIVCETQEQFDAEMADMARFHGRHMRPSMIGIGDDGVSASFDVLSFLQEPTKEICFELGAAAKDAEGQWRAPLAGTLKMDHPLVHRMEEGQSSVLGRDAFELNLLDPRGHDQKHEVTLSCSEGTLWVSVKFEDSDLEFKASV